MPSSSPQDSPDSTGTGSWPLGPPVLPQLAIHRTSDETLQSSSRPSPARTVPTFSRPLPTRPVLQSDDESSSRRLDHLAQLTSRVSLRQHTMAAPIRSILERQPSDGPLRAPRSRFPSSAAGGLGSLLSPPDADPDDKFFVPTYLSHSVYMKQLEKEHRAMIRAKQLKRSNSGDGSASNGPDVAAPLPPGSHRGLSHAVVERTPGGQEAQEPLTPLPSRWNKDDMWAGLEVDANNVVRYTAPKTYNNRDHEASAVRANHHMPPQCGIYYYEVTILDGKRDDTTIAVGFSSKTPSLSRPVGWEPESWAYHGDDGRCFTAQNVGKSYGSPFNKNDVIGCGVNFRDNSAFFTRNGVFIGTAFHDVVRGKLYPAVSLKRSGEMVKVNFGQDPFIFDIDQMTRGYRGKILDDVLSTNTSQLESGMSETDVIQALVLQFLQHDGYVDTARAFSEEMQAQKASLNMDTDIKVGGVSITDDEDANNRQRIRSAILEGDVDRALKYAQAFYPKVLPSNEAVHFKLRCRKFIEMVRRVAELKMSGSPSSRNNGTVLAATVQSMDLDQGRDAGTRQPTTLSDLEQEIISYGKSLQAEYSNDTRGDFTSGLQEIWSLLAYNNPLKEPQVKHMLDQQGRVVVAEELNSAILSSLGKSSRASIEKVYAQTSVLLDELRRDGGEGAFISVDDATEDIPNHRT